MVILQETTDWGEYRTPNHIYYVNDSKEKLLAYIKAGSNEPVMLSKPIKFSTRYRTFKEIKVI
jgi:transcription initiation factor IIF auxiliary subunit